MNVLSTARGLACGRLDRQGFPNHRIQAARILFQTPQSWDRRPCLRPTVWAMPHILSTCQCTDSNKNTDSVSSVDPTDADVPQGPKLTPGFMDGINWYCYVILGLIFLIDYTPLGIYIRGSDSPAVWLSALQWLVFVVPTLNQVREHPTWSIQETFKLRGSTVQEAAAGSVVGVGLWLAIAFATSAKMGTPMWEGIDPSSVSLPDQEVGLLLKQGGESLMSSLTSSPLYTAIFVAASPAVAEEIMFRGFLLSSVQSRLGSIDAASLCCALFAATHLSAEQFFPCAVLGFGCSLFTINTKSILPAILLHMSYNGTALVVASYVTHLQ